MPGNLCDVQSVLVGHATNRAGLTGCTVVLFDAPAGAVVGVDVRGSSPGTRETDLLSPIGRVDQTHALLLTGGSAFGLGAASGVVRFLEERGVGYDVRVARVPMVPSAVIFDLATGDPTARPDEGMGYEAAASARKGEFDQGSVGVGTGATVGKVLGLERAMKGGLGSVSVTLPGGLVVGSLVVVNAFGDVRDPSMGKIVAGPRREDGTLADSVEHLMEAAPFVRWGENTTLGIVATNARLSKAQVTKVAQMAQDGIARTVYPVHTSLDGDTVFAASVGEPSDRTTREFLEGPVGVAAAPDIVGAWGAHVTAEAVLRAVRSAEGLPGLPAASELGQR
ncbi:MAG: P1 family peptidase [Actinomycetota bacterium]|nr:P1 family peptidase [Actinomycetota bacterium]